MKNIITIKAIQKKCEMIARDSEVVKQFDLAGTYGDVSQQTICNYEKEYVRSLVELRYKIDEYLSDY